MINITINPNNKSEVLIKASGKYPVNNWVYTFRHGTHSESEALLLQSNLADHLDNLVREIKEEAYNLGYSHGRGKKTKKTWFSCLFKTDSV